MKNRSPIGIFDSGIGGLNTLKILKEKLPNEDFLYFADNINLPYGDKNKEEIIKFSTNIAKFLVKKNVKAILYVGGHIKIKTETKKMFFQKQDKTLRFFNIQF